MAVPPKPYPYAYRRALIGWYVIMGQYHIMANKTSLPYIQKKTAKKRKRLTSLDFYENASRAS